MADTQNERILEIFSKFIPDKDELDAVSRGESILENVSIDSMTMVYMVTELEKEFVLRFDIETLELIFENINTLSTYIKKTEQK